MSKLRVREVVIVEGKYDAVALASLVDGLILTTGGFSLFSDEEKKELIRTLGRKRGIVVLTDSDAAGFKIRHYIEKIAAECVVKNAYIPAVAGKEKRKSAPSKEGTLGVEGLPAAVLLQALRDAGVTTGAAPAGEKSGREITYTDLYQWGLSGGDGSAAHRRQLLEKLGLPQRLSKRALCQVLNSLYSYEEFAAVLQEKPVLFWDFHGTLTLPDVTWFDAAMEAAAEAAPETPLSLAVLQQQFSGTCLPWWSIPSRDTRHLTAPGAWWAHCEAEFASMFERCGFSQQQAVKIAPAIREKILEAARYTLYPDALQTLQTLQRRGYKSYILSNNFPELEQVVAALGLSPYFAGVLVSGKIGYDKPRPEIFAAAKAAAGNPAASVMIGDNVQDDLEGAKAAGFMAVGVHGRCSPLADHCVEELAELLDLLP